MALDTPRPWFVLGLISGIFETFFTGIVKLALQTSFDSYVHRGTVVNEDVHSLALYPSVVYGSSAAKIMMVMSVIAFFFWCVGFVCILIWAFANSYRMAEEKFYALCMGPFFARFTDNYYWFTLAILVTVRRSLLALNIFFETRAN